MREVGFFEAMQIPKTLREYRSTRAQEFEKTQQKYHSKQDKIALFRTIPIVLRDWQ